MKPFEQPQRSVKIKIELYIFISIQLSEMHGRDGKDKKSPDTEKTYTIEPRRNQVKC